jgi:NAD(P)-dependent dehydrogenase (short-subunit alcohol dehydrogenase family)
MDLKEVSNMYNFTNKTIVITGGAGVLGAEMACALVGCGANVAIIDRDIELAEEIVKKIDTTVGNYIIVYGDVLDQKKMEKAAKHIIKTFGDVYCLINSAGGNHPKATTSPDFSFFELEPESIKKVSDLNLLGTIIKSGFWKIFC